MLREQEFADQVAPTKEDLAGRKKLVEEEGLVRCVGRNTPFQSRAPARRPFEGRSDQMTGKTAVVLAMALASPAAFAQTAPPAAAPASGTKVEFGVEERVRSEAWDNITDHDSATYDSKTQYRFRTRVWSKINFGSKAEVMVGLNSESKKATRPDTEFKWDEAVFETAYLDYKFTDKLSARLGRQNLMRGEGFVIFDGSSLDGSRTAYFNALDVSCKLAPKSTLEFMAISDPRRDTYLPRFNESAYGPKGLNEWDEQALGLYYTDKSLAKTAIEGYFFHKTEKDDIRAKTSAFFQPDRKINTLGGRVVRLLGDGWSATGEFAYQWGTQDANPARELAEQDIRAWGGYAYVKKVFDNPMKPSIQLGYVAMSGDDPTTGKIEGWDPLFSRWPKYSELYIYTQVPEKGGPAYWTNTGMWQAEFLITPVKNLLLRGAYYKMNAFEAPAAPSAIFGTGKDRGNLWQVRADYTLNSRWKGHALYESLNPGDFYAGTDGGYFLRFEVVYTTKLNF